MQRCRMLAAAALVPLFGSASCGCLLLGVSVDRDDDGSNDVAQAGIFGFQVDGVEVALRAFDADDDRRRGCCCW